jgi:protein arginine N-methyltransferase 2
MLHHALNAPGGEDEDGEQAIDEESGTIKLKAEDKTSAGDNLTFLKSRLTWDKGDDGRERVLDADGNG